MRLRWLLLIALVAPLVLFSVRPGTDALADTCPAHAPTTQTSANSQATEPAVDQEVAKRALALVLETTVPAGAPLQPVAVDGSKNPEKVPIPVAYRLLVRVLAIPDTDPPADVLTRRDDKLTQIGILLPADRDAAVSALRGVRQELDGIEEQRRELDKLGAETGSYRTELLERERALLDQAVERLRGSQSREVAARLDAYVSDHVRRRIIIYGDLPLQATSAVSAH